MGDGGNTSGGNQSDRDERQAQKDSFAGITGGRALGGYDSSKTTGVSNNYSNPKSGGVKGARDLTDREKQKATFAGLADTPTTLAGLKEKAAEEAQGFTTAADLEAQDLEAVQTTLGIVVKPKSISLTRSITEALGEEHGLPADSFLSGNPEERDDLADAANKGQVRATSPKAATPTEESPLGLTIGVLGAAYDLFSFLASPPTTVIGALTGFPTSPFTLAKDLIDLDQLKDAGFVAKTPAAPKSPRSPSPSDRGGDSSYSGLGSVPTNALAEEDEEVTKPAAPKIPPRKPRPAGSGLASTVRTGFFGAPTKIRKVR